MRASDYIFDTAVECDRLERQGLLHGRERVLEHVKMQPGERLLDAGSGSGWVARTLGANFPGAEVTGVDVNPAYVEYATSLALAEHLPNVRFAVGDLLALDYPDATFDLVWSQFVVYFLPDPGSVIKEFRRVTRPGGQVFVAVHDEPLGRLDPAESDIEVPLGRFRDAIHSNFESRRLPMMFRRAGLVDIKVNIETDRIYTKIGAMPPEQRRNIEDVLTGSFQKMAHLFGGELEADRFLTKLLAYLERTDTSSITAYLVVEGHVPE
jgi:ubiquinone/menaquinone biosynthesis C-methylase UbiE